MGLRNNGDGDAERVDAAFRITGVLSTGIEIAIPLGTLDAWPNTLLNFYNQLPITGWGGYS